MPLMVLAWLALTLLPLALSMNGVDPHVLQISTTLIRGRGRRASDNARRMQNAQSNGINISQRPAAGQGEMHQVEDDSKITCMSGSV